ncbi:MAG: 5'/3'-nucleotidase SurE [Gammaproteobacteria bacterium]|nr:5'/3'-nucleotidase SurE [Gammaproteobacteria bacterium]
MYILITNDDGYLAPGIRILAEYLSSIAKITVVAPDRNKSGASNSLTLTRPLRAILSNDGFYYVDGTPTDCVHLAISGLLDPSPDMVVSGINAGANLGDDVLYSGTVAAAMEGRFLGLPAIAVSLAGESKQHYETAAAITKRIIENLVKNTLPVDTILNINVPDLELDEIDSIQATRLGFRHKAESMVTQYDPQGRPVYWVGPPGPAQDAGPGTDFYTVEHSQVSVTPLQIDLTRHERIDPLQQWLTDLA